MLAQFDKGQCFSAFLYCMWSCAVDSCHGPPTLACLLACLEQTAVRQLERTAEVFCYALLGPAMLAPRFIVSPVAVTEPSVVPTFEHTFPLPILELQARRLAGLPGTQPWPFGCVHPAILVHNCLLYTSDAADE